MRTLIVILILLLIPNVAACSEYKLRPVTDTGTTASDDLSTEAPTDAPGKPDLGDSSSEDTPDSSVPASDEPRTLTITWTSPFDVEEPSIAMSGEYVMADGSWGFTWRDMASTANEPSVTYRVTGVDRGDALRFSVEYVDAQGNVSWGCIAPYPPGTLQGTPTADVDGAPIPVSTADDPESNGCDLKVVVP